MRQISEKVLVKSKIKKVGKKTLEHCLIKMDTKTTNKIVSSGIFDRKANTWLHIVKVTDKHFPFQILVTGREGARPA